MSLTTRQITLLSHVLDTIIPPSEDGRFPGAGRIGLAEAFAERADMADVLAEGLSALERSAGFEHPDDFAGASQGDRQRVLESTAEAAPAFLGTLIAQSIVGYYQHEDVMAALGRPARPPFPLGYAVEATDFSILDPVRTRPRFYREP